jgi:hypothetical protein
MTPGAKIIYLAALLIGLSGGLLSGYKDRMRALTLLGETRLEIPPFALREFSLLQYTQADPEHAEAALLTYASVLEAMEKAKAEKTLMLELRSAYIRLALLKDAENEAEQSNVYMTKVRYWNSAAGGRDYSVSEMKAAQKRLDAVQ